MTTKTNGKNLVVVQLSGGNDALNTIIPYGDELYYDNRPYVNIPQEKILEQPVIRRRTRGDSSKPLAR